MRLKAESINKNPNKAENILQPGHSAPSKVATVVVVHDKRRCFEER